MTKQSNIINCIKKNIETENKSNGFVEEFSYFLVNNICLKTDTILLQYTFYQFQYFIITCLHGRNLSTKVSVKKF